MSKTASRKEYLEFVLDQTSLISGVSYRAMMGEYIVYLNEKVVGGIYDDRFLIKPFEAAKRLMPGAPREVPYEGAKEMLLVEQIDDRDFLKHLFDSIGEELYEKNKRRKEKGA